MLSAVKSNKNAVLGNTTVKSNDKCVFVYLYDTIIFAKVRGRVYYAPLSFPIGVLYQVGKDRAI